PLMSGLVRSVGYGRGRPRSIGGLRGPSLGYIELRPEGLRRRNGHLCRDGVLARAAVAAEDLLQVFDVDVEVVARWLDVVPLAVDRAAEDGAVAVAQQVFILHVDLAAADDVDLQYAGRHRDVAARRQVPASSAASGMAEGG